MLFLALPVSNVEWCNTEDGNLSSTIIGILWFSGTLLWLTVSEHFWTFLLVRITAVMIWWLVMMCLETSPRLCPQALTNGRNFWNSLTAPVVILLANRDVFCFTAGWSTLKSNSLGYFLSNKISASSVDGALYQCCTDINMKIWFSLEWILSWIIMLQAVAALMTKVQKHLNKSNICLALNACIYFWLFYFPFLNQYFLRKKWR